MSINLKFSNIERLITEADELVQQIHSDAIGNLKEEYHLQFEIHAQKLKKIKYEVHGAGDERKTYKTGAGVESVHEAVLDIVKTFRELKGYHA